MSLLGPADIRGLADKLGPPADETAGPELRDRRRHRAPDRPTAGLDPGDVVLEVGPGLGLARPSALLDGSRAGGRGRDRPRARRGAAAHGGRRRARGGRPAGRASRPTRCGSPELPDEAADRARRQPALQRRRAGAAPPAGAAARRCAAGWSWCRPRSPTGWPPARLQDLRRALGEGRVVRRRAPGRGGRPHRVLAGAQRRLRPGRARPAASRRRPRRPASRCSPSSTPPSPSAARPSAPPCAGWPGRRRAAEGRCTRPGSTRRPGRAARRADVRPHRRGGLHGRPGPGLTGRGRYVR